jgi:hypothetical protein
MGPAYSGHCQVRVEPVPSRAGSCPSLLQPRLLRLSSPSRSLASIPLSSSLLGHPHAPSRPLYACSVSFSARKSSRWIPGQRSVKTLDALALRRDISTAFQWTVFTACTGGRSELPFGLMDCIGLTHTKLTTLRPRDQLLLIRTRPRASCRSIRRTIEFSWRIPQYDNKLHRRISAISGHPSERA